MTLEEALSFRLTNGMMLGQLPEEDWRREIERVTRELNEMHRPDQDSGIGKNRHQLQARLEYTKALLNALQAIIARPPAQTRSI